MRRALACVVVLVSGVVRAEPPITLHDGLTSHDDDEDGDDEHLLHLDTLPLPNAAELGVHVDGDQLSTIALGKTSWAELHGTQWSDTRDFPLRGWSARLTFAHDFGPFTVAVTGAVDSIDSQFGGVYRYRDVGVSIGRVKRYSRWVTAWLALSAGYRSWLGKPPDGEHDGGQLTLSAGFTFK